MGLTRRSTERTRRGQVITRALLELPTVPTTQPNRSGKRSAPGTSVLSACFPGTPPAGVRGPPRSDPAPSRRDHPTGPSPIKRVS